jgi:PAS domain S-box-containing protein/diguanylate cyclase (GGDEF)-like protein
MRRVIGNVWANISALFSKTALIEARHQLQIDQNILSYSTDKHDHFIFVSPAFCLKIGYSSNELIGQSRSAYYHAQFPSSAAVKISKSIASHLSWSGEMMYQSKHGELFWHRAQLEPIVKNDYLLGYSSIEYDITDKKRLEQASEIDDTTGLFNRFKIEQLLKYEFNRSSRTSLPFSVILLNFTGIELVRSKEGESALNEMLLSLANIVNCEIRLSDTAGRWKAEQLLIICPETTRKGANLLGAKIAHSIETHNFSSAIVPKVCIAADKLDRKEGILQMIERLELELLSNNDH